MFKRCVVLALSSALALSACGSDAQSRAEEAVEAREGNVVQLGPVEYRVVMFRQINHRIAPDRRLVHHAPPEGHGYYAAFLVACNTTDEPVRLRAEVRLENAFGSAYRPVEIPPGAFAYDRVRLAADECLPAGGSQAEGALPGAAVVFAVPFADTGERPFVLVLRDEARGQGGRVEVDL